MIKTESSSMTVKTPAGDIPIQGGIYARWLELKNELTPDGDDVQAHLEYPLGPESVVPAHHGGGTEQLFRRGMIVERADGRAFVVYGAIYDYYIGRGGTCSAIGQPISDEEESAHGGRVVHFQRGDIYWRSDFGPREVRGDGQVRAAARANPFERTLIDRAGLLARRMLTRAITRLVG
jgi:hypothetical protein